MIFFDFLYPGGYPRHVIGYPENSYFCKANQPILCKSNYGENLDKSQFIVTARHTAQPSITVGRGAAQPLDAAYEELHRPAARSYGSIL